MANKKRSKAEMKRVYFMRRLIALLLLVLVITLIVTRCTNKRAEEKDNNASTPIENQGVGENQVVGNVNDPALNNQADLNQNENQDQEDDLNKRLLEEEDKLQKDYETYAVVSLDKDNKAYSFTLKDEYKDLVDGRESEEVKEEFDQFWENFKYKLKETSTNLAEFLEPGIELQVLDPKDNTTVILMVSDGAELFDRTSD